MKVLNKNRIFDFNVFYFKLDSVAQRELDIKLRIITISVRQELALATLRLHAEYRNN